MNRIYVFTSTGNSLKMAKNIAKNLDNTEILSIPNLMKQGNWTISGESIGLIFPCYYGTIPQLVRKFIENATEINGNFCYAMVSAGRSTGISLKVLEKTLLSRNQKLDYGRNLMIASNYMNGWYYEMVMPTKDKLEQNIMDADKLCEEVSKDIILRNRKMDKSSFINFMVPYVLSPKRYQKDTREWDSEFSVGNECNGCGICVKSCPVDNIKMSNGKPEFSHNCQRCMACIQFCNQKSFYISGKRMNKIHYSHPDIDRFELFQFNKIS